MKGRKLRFVEEITKEEKDGLGEFMDKLDLLKIKKPLHVILRLRAHLAFITSCFEDIISELEQKNGVEKMVEDAQNFLKASETAQRLLEFLRTTDLETEAKNET